MPTPPASPRLYPLGDGAVVVEFGGGISADTLGCIEALARQLAATRLPALRETVPGYTTLTVFYDPARLPGPATPYEQLTAWLRAQLAAAEAHPPSTAPGTVLELPVCYGGTCGPDLAAVARHAGLPEAEVVVRHAAPAYLVHLLGFLPGFAYLGGLDASLATPRRATPRARVPAGAVGIAGKQTGVYPLASPGGWQLIGCTPLRLFTPDSPQPTLLTAGQHLRFVPITEAEFHRRNENER